MNLAALERAIHADAEAETGRAEAEAAGDARERLADAERRALALAEAARRQGEQAAAHEALRRRAAGRRRARELRLRAERELLDDARAQARQAALGLRDDPHYPQLLERLRRAALAQLGEGAEVEVDPPGLGGVIGRAGPVRVDYTLPALADWILDAMGGELRRLWT